MYGYYYKAGKSWEDTKLWEATKDNPQEDINVESFLNQDNYWNIGSFKEFANEMQLVLKADYSYPIILDEEYKLVDGAHRLVHAYIDGKTSIKGVIIKNNQFPEPDYDEVKECQNRQKFTANVDPEAETPDFLNYLLNTAEEIKTPIITAEYCYILSYGLGKVFEHFITEDEVNLTTEEILKKHGLNEDECSIMYSTDKLNLEPLED